MTLDAHVLHTWAQRVQRRGLVYRGTPHRVLGYSLSINQRGAMFTLEGSPDLVYRQCNVTLVRVPLSVAPKEKRRDKKGR